MRITLLLLLFVVSALGQSVDSPCELEPEVKEASRSWDQMDDTEGFLDSLLSLMSRDLKAPDHTTLSRRNQIVVVPPLTRAHDRPIDLIVDSTGLKILGRGEWNAHKHKASKKRRDWRKLHIGVDAKGFIVAAELTASSRDDASTLPDLLAPLEVPIRRFTADGAYDHKSVYGRASAAGTENVVIVIPPRRSALLAGPTDGS